MIWMRHCSKKFDEKRSQPYSMTDEEHFRRHVSSIFQVEHANLSIEQVLVDTEFLDPEPT